MTLPLREPAPVSKGLLAEIIQGLGGPQKTLPSKLFYDRRGSRLFDLICETPEYYVTRTELAIMRRHVGEMAEILGADCLLIEPGAGNGLKTRCLLGALRRPVAYMPVDVADAHLRTCARQIRAEHPGLTVIPICADFTQPFPLPTSLAGARAAIYFPGSTIGNFEPEAALRLLAAFRERVGADGALLIGVDTRKDIALLEQAYDDSAGWTARFNLNVLLRLNREYGGTFDLDHFSHQAFYAPAHGRIEMHLRSRRAQTVRAAGRLWALRSGETIHTENSYKYTPAAFAVLAALAGWRLVKAWSDPGRLFCVQAYNAG